MVLMKNTIKNIKSTVKDKKHKWKWMHAGKKRLWQMIMQKNPADCHEHKRVQINSW